MTSIDISNIQTLNVGDLTNVDWNYIAKNSLSTETVTDASNNHTMLTGDIKVGWLKNPTDMGITSPNVQNPMYSKNNLKRYQDYNDLLIKSAGSPASKIPNNGQPLGNREFIKKTGMSCQDPEGNIQSRYYVVDGMSYYQTNPENTGLVFSAYQSLQDIDALKQNAKQITSDPSYKDNTCVQVNLIKDGKGTTESGYISTNEYNIWRKKTPPIFMETFVEGHGSCGGGGGHDGGGGGHGGGGGGHGGHGRGYVGSRGAIEGGGGSDGWFYGWSSYPENVVIPTYVTEDDVYEMRKYHDSDAQSMVISDDIITVFFLGSITVLGLYVVYRMLDRVPQKM